MGLYDFNVKKANGMEQSLQEYEGKVVCIVNTASKCGLTPQFEELQQLYAKYKDEGLVILGFPSNDFAGQEPKSNDEIQEFCSLNYGVKFPVFGKIHVNGEGTDPLYSWLKEQAPGIMGMKSIKWNFTKFLISRDGQEVIRFAPNTSPVKMEDEIRRLLNK